jgi:hypothetical protein
MKNPDLLEELLDETFHLQMAELISNEGTNFVALTTIAGLEKETSFQHSDLRGVDFSGCDLSGFNFAGSDLRETTAIDAYWDHTTVFDDALLSGSPFSHTVELDRRFSENPDAEAKFNRLRNEDVYEKSSWILTNSDKNHEMFELNKIIALKLFEEEANVTVRNSLIYGAKGYFTDRDEYRDFITSIFAQRTTDPTTFRTALNVLAKVFNYDPTVQNLLLQVVQQCDFPHRISALEGLVAARDYPKISGEIKETLFSREQTSFRLHLMSRAIEESSLNVSKKPRNWKHTQDLSYSSNVLTGLDFHKSINDYDLVRLLIFSRLKLQPSQRFEVESNKDQSRKIAEYVRYFSENPRQFESALKASQDKRSIAEEGLPLWARDVRQDGKALVHQALSVYNNTGVRFKFVGRLAKALDLPSSYNKAVPSELGRVSSILHTVLA